MSPSTSPRSAVVVLAGGSGSRVGADRNKVLLELAGVPILAHSVRNALGTASIRRLVVVHRPEDRRAIETILPAVLGPHDVWLVEGGATRHDSEWAALQALAPPIEAGQIDTVAIHDAARPLAGAQLFDLVLETASRVGAAVPGLPAGVLSHHDGRPVAADLVAVQTPQAFRAADLLAAYRRAAADGFTGTDTAACLEAYADLPIAAVPGDRRNLKVTFPEDLALAERLLASRPGERQRPLPFPG
jgi:2-C-methyl-D-erythritol 4-phosphate cytidylyltransferase